MKRLIFALVCLATVASCSKGDNQNMTVNGNIEGLKKGMLYFQKYEDTAMVTLDSLKIEGDANFSFSAQVEGPELFYLYLDKNDGNDANDMLEFFGEPGNITITTSHDYFAPEAKIEGSKTQDTYSEYQKIADQFKAKNLDLVAERLNALKDGREEVMDSLDDAIARNNKRSVLYTLNFMFNNQESPVVPYLVLSETPNLSQKYLDSIKSVLSPEVLNTKYGKAFTEFTEQVREEESKAVTAQNKE
ncbi:DUF4369 domain-containing protein [Robertkochia aurantiaca]|uniref:DUF4369 domain-containing protein n=1 Tax=Robertkochia aurantiaca TaxID=2873700 RepID=UPI001CCE00E5|nr:DUF4369 domain-containing protein [Robertkochia sp. 3YJGBD-33]